MLEAPGIHEFRERVATWFRESLPAGWNTAAYEEPASERHYFDFLRTWQRTLYDGGWAGLSWLREYGGAGATLVEQAVFQEERDRCKAPPEIASVGTRMVGPMLIRHGTEEQRVRYLQPMLKGDELWCQGFSEPGAGSDLAALQTRAVQSGESWIVTGRKIWTSRAQLADRMILLARTDSSAAKHQGIGAFILDMDSPGIVVEPIQQINGSTEFCEVIFEGVDVPEENVIGEATDGWRVAMSTLAHERVASTRAYEMRRLLRDLVAMIDADTELHPEVLADLGHHFCDAHAGVLLFHRVLTQAAEEDAPGANASLTKLQSSELSVRLGQTLMHVTAPDSLSASPSPWMGGDLSPLWEYVNSFKHTIAAGTSEIQRNILGERVLGLPRR